MSFPIEISYGEASIKFDVYDAKDFIGRLLGLINKDKKYVCLLLDFSVKFLRHWYNDIVVNYGPIKIKGGYKELDYKEKKKLDVFMGQSKYVPITSLLASNFVELIDAYKSGQGIVKNKLDFETLQKFHKDISNFESFGLEESAWRPKVTENGIDLKLLKRWETEMEVAVNSHAVALSKILKSLNCNQDHLSDAIQKYKQGKGL